MASDKRERLARVALTYLDSPNDRDTYTLVVHEGAVGAFRLLTTTGSDWTDTLAARRASIALRRTEDRVLIPGDPGWPPALDLVTDRSDKPAHRYGLPLALWAHGNAELPSALNRAVTITGTRRATEYGAQVASDIAAGCAQSGWTVVAGGGFGIDAAAHRAALAVDTVTVAVLPGGLDRRFPAGHNALFDRIAQNGLLLSAAPPGSDTTRARRLVQLYLLAALTIGAVVVESPRRSVSILPLNTALSLGRAAMAVPGPVTSAMSAACHQMLRDPGVLLVTDAGEVLDFIDR